MGNYWLDSVFSPKLYLIELLEDVGCTVTQTSLFGKAVMLDVFFKNFTTQITEGMWRKKNKKEIKILADKICQIISSRGKQMP